MGREVRRVPPGWQHPKAPDGRFIPLFDGLTFLEQLENWELGKRKWESGFRESFMSLTTVTWVPRMDEELDMTYEDWAGEAPNPKWFTDLRDESVCTKLMMYETTTEGTPISPAYDTPEEVAEWCTNNESWFAGQQTTYDNWLYVASKYQRIKQYNTL